LLEGAPFLLGQDDVLVSHGFYRNEYVLATSKEKAASIAIAKTLKKFQKRMPEFIDGRPLHINANKVTAGMPFWRLFRNEGFVFFSDEGEDPV